MSETGGGEEAQAAVSVTRTKGLTRERFMVSSLTAYVRGRQGADPRRFPLLRGPNRDGSMPSVDERILRGAARVLGVLPSRAKKVLAGPAVSRDGHALDPEMAILLRFASGLTAATAPSLDFFREAQRKDARVAGGTPLRVGAVRELTVDGAEGPLRARHYAPERDHARDPAPLLVFFHGGGFVFGDVDTHDAPCRFLCRHAGAHVLSVEYRLAPEHPFPAAPLDARAALAWAFAHARELGADPSRVGVAGDSAGGNLSAAASWMAARDGGPVPRAQILVYPAVDRRVAWPSIDTFAEGFLLTRASIQWFHATYSGKRAEHEDDPRLNPLAASDLSGMPRTLVVTAGFDPLRDEGEAYAAALAKAGNDVTVRRFGPMVHGFFNMVGVSRVARDAVAEIAGAARVLLA